MYDCTTCEDKGDDIHLYSLQTEDVQSRRRRTRRDKKRRQRRMYVAINKPKENVVLYLQGANFRPVRCALSMSVCCLSLVFNTGKSNHPSPLLFTCSLQSSVAWGCSPHSSVPPRKSTYHCPRTIGWVASPD